MDNCVEIKNQRDTAWREDRMIRKLIGAREFESTYDEIQSMMADLKRLKAENDTWRGIASASVPTKEELEVVAAVPMDVPEDVRWKPAAGESFPDFAEIIGMTPGKWEAGREEIGTMVEGKISKWIYADGEYLAVSYGDRPWSTIMTNARGMAAVKRMFNALLVDSIRSYLVDQGNPMFKGNPPVKHYDILTEVSGISWEKLFKMFRRCF